MEGRELLKRGALSAGDSFDLAPGIPALYLEHTQISEVVVSVGGFVLRLHKYDHGQQLRWCFVANGKRYYAQGHCSSPDDASLAYSVHGRSETDETRGEFFDKNGSAVSFTKANVHHYYYRRFECYKTQVDALLAHGWQDRKVSSLDDN